LTRLRTYNRRRTRKERQRVAHTRAVARVVKRWRDYQRYLEIRRVGLMAALYGRQLLGAKWERPIRDWIDPVAVDEAFDAAGAMVTADPDSGPYVLRVMEMLKLATSGPDFRPAAAPTADQ